MDDVKEEKKKHKIEEEEMVREDDEDDNEKETQPEAGITLKEDEKAEEESSFAKASEDKEKDTDVEEDSEEDEEEQDEEDDGEDMRKSEVLRRDLNQFVRDHQPSYNLNPKGKRLSGKLVTLILFMLTIAVIGGAIYFVAGVGSPKKQEQTVISPPKSTTSSTPTPTPKALNRSEWSFEVLNGGGVTGAAKKLADQLKALGYQVVKVANADKDIQTNQFFVQEDLMAGIDSIVVDIKDIIKIASISGKLKDSTASARIIIGKE
ncbi:LytR C-terminal domain-containing protein [Candidatus Daviesbacteria bacterium]|nr:LytR C-terminal domain-containing protein [Candidatus Daviesbacteria bacterium]